MEPSKYFPETSKLVKINFPIHIMDPKLAKVKNRDFRPSENKLCREEDKKTPIW